MKFLSLFAGLLISGATLSSAIPTAPICDIVCVEPSQHDPHAEASCNCAEKHCPFGLECPVDTTNGYNATKGACGCVPPHEQCLGLKVECIPDYSYGWNKTAQTCQCNHDSIYQ